jgi:hypothetical protein
MQHTEPPIVTRGEPVDAAADLDRFRPLGYDNIDEWPLCKQSARR